MSPETIKQIEAQVRDTTKDGNLIDEITKELRLKGMSMSDIYLLKVSNNSDRTPTNIVGAVVDDNGDFWIVGDVNPFHKATESKYNCLVYNRLDQEALGEPAWMDGKPW